MKEVDTPGAFQTLQAETPATRLPAKRQRAEVAAPSQPAAPTTPMDLLRIVTERGANVAEISAFMDLMERQRKAEAEQAYVRAMAAFKKNPPVIVKNKTAQMFKDGKPTYTYAYADLAAVCGEVVAALANVGISHNWTVQQASGNITVTCSLTHELGHSSSATLSASADQSGGKNSIQAIGSAVKYLERYTLLAVTGIAVQDAEDDDGRGFNLDTRLADKWIGKVKSAKTDAEAVAVWNEGIVEIEKAKDREAYTEFKDAVANRRAELAGAA